MSNAVVTSQPTPSAPLEEHVNTEKFEPGAMPLENVVVNQPALNYEKLSFAQTEAVADEEEIERRRRRNDDYCCFACADSCTDDTWCWYIMCRMFCRCLGSCCEGCADCLDSCGEGCAKCLHGCCEGDCCMGDADGGCGGDTDGCCSGDADDGCCSGGSGGSDDCDCDCCFD